MDEFTEGMIGYCDSCEGRDVIYFITHGNIDGFCYCYDCYHGIKK